MDILLGNYYFFVMLFTVSYGLAFIYYLSSRFQYSQTARRFVLFLVGLILWSIKDAVGEMLYPYLAGDAEGYRRAMVLISPLFLGLPILGFNMLTAVYNAAVPRRRRFRHVDATTIGLCAMMGGVFVAALLQPSVLYANFAVQGHSYVYDSGPGMLLFGLTVALAAGIPVALLFAVSWRNPKSEAFSIALGTTLAVLVALATNVLPDRFGLQHLPRLGCLSACILAGLTFYGIVRHGTLFSLTHILAERARFRMVADGMESLLTAYDERTIYQKIADNARDVSESALVCIVFFAEGDRSYEVRALSCRGDAVAGAAAQLPLAPGTLYDLGDVAGLRRQLASRDALVFGSLAEFLRQGATDSSLLPAFPVPLRHVMSYPLLHENGVRGALVLMAEQAPVSMELCRVFALQCALVMRFASQIAELEKMRRLEEQVYRSHKMEAIGQLAGGIAHDFNNTLSGVSGYAQLIKRKFATDTPELKEYVDAIISAARRSADLTEKLLAFARKGKLQIVPVDMHQVIQDALQILQPTIDKRITITCKLDARPSLVLADPTQLQNVLINLAINARNAMPAGGELTFRTEVVTYASPQWVDEGYEVHPGSYLVTSVVDTGIGIDKQTQRRIFEPFFTTDTTGKGSGLGLASVYGTIKSHNGVITVQSAPGKGATFRVYLQLAPGSSPPAAPPRKYKTEALVRGQGHVIVVDDEEMICHLSREMLTFLGYSVTAFRSGQEAVEYFREHADEVDVAIIDIMMPHMDGYETFHELRRIKSDVKVIMTTGYAMPRDTRHMATLGLCGFIQKPFESGKLSQLLYDTLHGSTPAAPAKA